MTLFVGSRKIKTYIMLLDLLIFPLLSLTLFSTKYGLFFAGIASPVILLTCFFALFHLAITLYTYFKLKDYDDRIVGRSTVATTMAFMAAFTATFTYMLLSFFPILKSPFFFLRYIPTNQYWLEHLIVGIPTYLVYRLSDYIVGGLLEDQVVDDNMDM